MEIKTLKDIGSYRTGDAIKLSKRLEFLSGAENVSSIKVLTDKGEELSFNKSEYENVKSISAET